MISQLLKVEEVSNILRINYKEVIKLADDNIIPFINLHSSKNIRLFRESDIQKFIDTQFTTQKELREIC